MLVVIPYHDNSMFLIGVSDSLSRPLGKLFPYTQKTGQHVYCPLPEFVLNELEPFRA